MGRLSVIVPVYNVEKYLPQCVESILSQSLEDIEVILIDDGSTDSSGLICEEYAGKDTRVKVIHQENQGIFEARRRGLLESTCEYVTYVDGDDFVDMDSYALAKESMDNHIDLVVFQITRYYHPWDQRKESGNYPTGLYDKERIEKVIWPNMIWDFKQNGFGMDPSICTKIVRRELASTVFQKYASINICYGEDSAVLFPLLKYTRTLEIKSQSYYYHRQRDQNMVAGYLKDERFLDKLYTLYCCLRAEFQENPQILKQIEYFYMESIRYRRWVYEGRGYEQDREFYNRQYLFPFDKVKKGEWVIIYGAGTVGKTYMDQLSQVDYCEAVLWVDRNYQNCQAAGVSPVEEILRTDYDKIVIAIQNPDVRATVAGSLEALGVRPDQILF